MPEHGSFHDPRGEDFYKQYEKQATQKGGYERLGAEPDPKWQTWGNVEVREEDGSVHRESFYTSPEVARRLFTEPIAEFLREVGAEADDQLTMADFGGASGALLQQVHEQLRDGAGYDHIKPVVIDKNEEAIKQATERGLAGVVSSLAKIPLASGGLDIAISRFAFQYLARSDETSDIDMSLSRKLDFTVYEAVNTPENQPAFLSELYRSMRRNGVAVIVYPCNENVGFIWDSFMKHTQEISSLSHLALAPSGLRRFTGLSSAQKLAEEAGFTVRQAREVDWIEFRITPEAIFDRFALNEQQQQIIRDLYERQFEQYSRTGYYDVDFEPLTKALKMPIGQLILTTENKPAVGDELKDSESRESFWDKWSI